MSVYGLVGRVTASASFSRSVAVDLVQFAALDVEAEHPHLVLVPGHFAFAHPERLDLDLVLRSFVVLAAGFAVGAAHQELAAGDRHHVERDVAIGDHVGVGLHLGRGRGGGVFDVGRRLGRVGRQSDPRRQDAPRDRQTQQGHRITPR